VTVADNGDFCAFYRQEYALLVRWLIVRGACCVADAEDAAQRAFTEVWCRWSAVGNRHGYLYCVARNELGHLYEQGIAARRAGELTGQQTEMEVPIRQQAATVLEYLLALPPKQRMVLACHYDGDARSAVPARWPAVTIRSNLRHARASLRELVAAPEPDLRERVCGAPANARL
jgi:DNA-directed RNA polymerase specialized sigma24 family protein